MKEKILTYLREADGYVSGQELCEKLGVSRTAIWKHINQLIDDDLLRTNHPSTDRAYAPVGYGIRKISKETK